MLDYVIPCKLKGELLKEKIDYMEDAYKKLNYKIKLYKENMI